jgi:glycosyltransferase involved in cell wall biosynthesis
MKIAQVAPLYESVPPKFYGGTERVVYYLTEELVRQGHEVTLFASGDSKTNAELRSQCDQALRLNKNIQDPFVYHVLMSERVFSSASEFDIIHCHIDYWPYSLIRRSSTPALSTLHGRLDLPDFIPILEEFSDVPFISISQAQRAPVPNINWQGNVYHGLPKNLYSFHEAEGEYLAFLGRISPEKRLDRAIAIAKQADMLLRIAAKVDKNDQKYFEEIIKPELNHPLIEYVGEIGEREKESFLGNAHALLFPIDWPEPFGLVMIESMACGTPVIAFPCGSVPEIMKDGVSGFICREISQAVESVKKVANLSRKRCRQYFEEHFTSERMASDYLKIYQQLTGKEITLGLTG